jgi:hypothetical protein
MLATFNAFLSGRSDSFLIRLLLDIALFFILKKKGGNERGLKILLHNIFRYSKGLSVGFLSTDCRLSTPIRIQETT